uniref:Reverse transcriptase domain-containing protein n=1 Tax=Tanacetum cinerariifolium TaxID=118510 RepID=A0A6L2JVX9_TANCI|nr:reverse transcriptase domain-containing protein [Tanacetum cinerariifolium]
MATNGNSDDIPPAGGGDLPVPDLRTMEELCQPTLNGRGGPIAPIAIQEMNFGLKNNMIQQVQIFCQFHGLPGDDANKHLEKFLHVTQSIKVNGVTDDALCLIKEEIDAQSRSIWLKPVMSMVWVCEPDFKKAIAFELKGQFLKELDENTFGRSKKEDANEHIDKALPNGGKYRANAPGYVKEENKPVDQEGRLNFIVRVNKSFAKTAKRQNEAGEFNVEEDFMNEANLPNMLLNHEIDYYLELDDLDIPLVSPFVDFTYLDNDDGDVINEKQKMMERKEDYEKKNYETSLMMEMEGDALGFLVNFPQ